MLTLFERNTPIDLQTVCDVLHRRDQLQKAGGAVALAELTEAAVTVANVRFHAGIVKEKALLRSMINIGQDLTAAGQQQEELQAILARTQASLNDIASTQRSFTFTDIDSLIRDT